MAGGLMDPMFGPIDFTPKRGRYGDVRWMGHYTTGHRDGGTTYVMFGGGSRWNQITSSGTLEVVQRMHHPMSGRDGARRNPAPDGWDVIVNGVPYQHHQLKSDAQRAAEALTNQEGQSNGTR